MALTPIEYTNSTDRIVLLVHCLVFCCIFGIVIDALIWNILYYRQKLHYMRSHMCHGNSLLIVFVANQIMLYVRGVKFFEGPYVFIIEVLIFVLFTLQFAIGLTVYRHVNQAATFIDVSVKKRVHIMGAVCIYCLGKVKSVMLTYYYLYGWSESIFWVILSVYTFLLILSYSLYYLYYKNASEAPKPMAKRFKDRKRQKIFYDLSQAIRSREFDGEQSCPDLQFLNDSGPKEVWIPEEPTEDQEKPDPAKRDPVELFWDTLWSVFEDKIFEIKDLPHSAGKYLIRWCHRKDVTKYIHGLSPLVIKDSRSRRFSLLQHKHSFFFRHYVNKNIIGLVRQGVCMEPEVAMLGEWCQSGDRRQSINLYSQIDIPKREAAGDRPVTTGAYRYDFKLTNSILIGPEFGIHFIERREDAAVANPAFEVNLYWVENLGKYSLMTYPDSQVFLGQPMLFLNPKYLKLRLYRLQEFYPEIYVEHLAKKTFDHDYLVAQEEVGVRNWSNYLIVAGRLPLDRRLQNFKVKWGLGFNLGFTESSFHRYTVVAKDEGILPFIDFLEIIFQQLLRMFDGADAAKHENNELWIFSRGTELVFANGLKVQFLLFASPGFLSVMRMLGFYHLHLIMALQPTVRNLLVNNVTVFSKDVTPAEYPHFKVADETTPPVIEELLRIHSPGYERVVVSGDAQFARALFAESQMSDEDFSKVIFL